MLIVFVRFSRNTDSDDDSIHANNNFPHLANNPRLQLLEQFKYELYENTALRGYWTTLHDFDTMDGEHEPDFFVWIKFCWPGTLVEFTTALQKGYDQFGMAGDWQIIDAIHNDGLFTHDEIVAACRAALAHDERVGD